MKTSKNTCTLKEHQEHDITVVQFNGVRAYASLLDLSRYWGVGRPNLEAVYNQLKINHTIRERVIGKTRVIHILDFSRAMFANANATKD